MTKHAVLFILVMSYNRVRKNIVLPTLIKLKGVKKMAKRRRTVIEELHEEELEVAVRTFRPA